MLAIMCGLYLVLPGAICAAISVRNMIFGDVTRGFHTCVSGQLVGWRGITLRGSFPDHFVGSQPSGSISNASVSR